MRLRINVRILKSFNYTSTQFGIFADSGLVSGLHPAIVFYPLNHLDETFCKDLNFGGNNIICTVYKKKRRSIMNGVLMLQKAILISTTSFF